MMIVIVLPYYATGIDSNSVGYWQKIEVYRSIHERRSNYDEVVQLWTGKLDKPRG